MIKFDVRGSFAMEFLQYSGQINGQSYGDSEPQGKMRKRSYKSCGGGRIGDDSLTPARQRSQANARERDRTHSVNTAFSTLRTLIPTEPKDRKLSKIETLRLASSYISHLGTQLMAGPIDQPCLRYMRDVENDGSLFARHQVCTFCISHKKSVRPINDKYECSNLEGQIFLTPVTSPTASSDMLPNSLINTDDLTNNIYY